MTVFRANSEIDPMPATTAQIDQQAAQLAGKQAGPRATFTGQDAGLSQSLNHLRNGYVNAAKVQSEQNQQAAIQRASVDSQIAANTPATGVEFIGHRPEQYEAGDSSRIPTTDPVWKMPIDHLRTNIQLFGETNSAIEKLSQTRSQSDFQHAAELGERLQQSLDRDLPRDPQIELTTKQPLAETQPSPQARPETFPDGQSVHVTQNADGTLHVEYATGERFDGDPLAVAQEIGRAHVNTKRWAQTQRAQAPQQQVQPIVPASAVQYDENGAPVIDMGQTAVTDPTFAQLTSIAQALGYNDPNELVADQIELRNRTDRLQQELTHDREERHNYEVAARFIGEHPEFPNSPEAIAALGQVIEANNLDWLPGNMALAHAAAVRDGLYRPLSDEEIRASMGMDVQVARPTPPPMIRGNSPESSSWQSGANDPQTMPLDQLRKLAIRQQLEGNR